MTPSFSPRRLLCSQCQRPLRTCLCHWIRPTVNRVSVLVLQHSAEVHHAKGSARLLSLSLTDCSCRMGERFDPIDLLAGSLDGTALLYPAAPGAAAEASAAACSATIHRLVVLDGTWRQSRSLLRQNPWLLQLPRFTLASPPPSLYRIRQPHSPEQRSTLEATCLALGQLESRPAHYEPLVQAFAAWTADALARRTWGSSPPSA